MRERPLGKPPRNPFGLVLKIECILLNNILPESKIAVFARGIPLQPTGLIPVGIFVPPTSQPGLHLKLNQAQKNLIKSAASVRIKSLAANRIDSFM